jgi:hypothetical protein
LSPIGGQNPRFFGDSLRFQVLPYYDYSVHESPPKSEEIRLSAPSKAPSAPAARSHRLYPLRPRPRGANATDQAARSRRPFPAPPRRDCSGSWSG